MNFHISLGFSESVIQKVMPMQETQEALVLSLGQKDPLEKDRVTHSSILAWEIPWTEEPVGLQSLKSQKSRIQLSI